MGRRRKSQHQKVATETTTKTTAKTTADYLARAVFDDLLPQHPQTCEDYGLTRAVMVEEKCNLMGLYIGLIKIMGISPQTIHSWRVRGVLVDEIKAAFYKIPAGSRGGYFPWFLRNQHVVALAGQPLSQEELCSQEDAILLRTWRLTGGSQRDSPGQIRAALSAKPTEERTCYTMYTLTLSGHIPTPSRDQWIDFGFASCASESDAGFLGVQYRGLIATCTFKEFCDAYRNGLLLHLFYSKGLRWGISVVENDQLRDLLSGPQKKSVWLLKQFVLRESSDAEDCGMAHSASWMDYGFSNCENGVERQKLKKVYNEFFVEHNGDALSLHEAAIKGNLHGFLSNIMERLHSSEYQRLLKNSYPIAHPDIMEHLHSSKYQQLLENSYPVARPDKPDRSWFSLSPFALLISAAVPGVALVMYWIHALSL